jgi:crotonobetainyl-CoA:carnitine CoA-transferase CaiB-like acyl-CoA transferase
MLVDIDAPGSGPIKVLGTPVRLSAIDQEVPPRPPPALGEHTEEVLGSIGVSAAEIRRLRDAGAI